MKFYWHIEADKKGYYSFISQAMPEFDGGEGFFTLDEITEIQKAFSATDNPDVPRSNKEAIQLKNDILKQTLSETRWQEYQSLK